MKIDRPKAFAGSKQEQVVNFASHHFVNTDDDIRCSNCDCKPWYRSASYRCGASIPREVVEVVDAIR